MKARLLPGCREPWLISSLVCSISGRCGLNEDAEQWFCSFTLQKEQLLLTGLQIDFHWLSMRKCLFKVQSEFSVQSMTKNVFIDNHFKTIYWPVRSECSSCMVFLAWRQRTERGNYAKTRYPYIFTGHAILALVADTCGRGGFKGAHGPPPPPGM